MTTSVLTQAHKQWANRPADERFLSLPAMHDHFVAVREESHQLVAPAAQLRAIPSHDHTGMAVETPDGTEHFPTHWAFGQLASLAEAPAGYLRSIPSPIAADCINYGLSFRNEDRDVGVLVRENGESTLAAATGPRYGRIWNADVVQSLIDRFGDGVSGDWRVPGTFGQELDAVTGNNTTLYASDRNMFVFLADERNRIEVPDRRDGQPGSFAKGFFVWNSEVGDCTLGIGTFLFDYVCSNRMVWGADQYMEIKLRHTSSAPDRFVDDVLPALKTYANSGTESIVTGIEAARKARLEDKLDSFLAERFGKRMVEPIKAVHQLEEQRPIETLWDASTAVTAYARELPNNDTRISFERKAGEILKLAA